MSKQPIRSASSQRAAILQHLHEDTITAAEALRLYGCARCAARIGDLRKEGYTIHSKLIEARNRKRQLVRVSQYWLA